MTAKLCVLVVALTVIARARVAILPGWVVPLPALILAAELGLCAVLAAWLICRDRLAAAKPVSFCALCGSMFTSSSHTCHRADSGGRP